MKIKKSPISITAHYTGYVWYSNGLSDRAFVTGLGRFLYYSLVPLNYVARKTGYLSLEDMLIARHRLIDSLLEDSIENKNITQILEIASGLSPRGWRFCRDYKDRGLKYIEGDLPDMVRLKKGILNKNKLEQENHYIVELDALSIEDIYRIAEEYLDNDSGAAIITEGLLTYMDNPSVLSMWQRFSNVLSKFPRGCYLSNIHLKSQNAQMFNSGIFKFILRTVTRGNIYLDFKETSDVNSLLKEAGFNEAVVHDVRDLQDIGEVPANSVFIIEAQKSRDSS